MELRQAAGKPGKLTLGSGGAYIKPDRGIPKTDLAETVQTSLDRADTALQPSDLSAYRTATEQDLIDAGRQATLVSGENIKTVNGQTLLGAGDLVIQGALPPGGSAGQIPVRSGADNGSAWQYPQYSRPNLLDNWYFVGGGSQLGYGVFPINQRGQAQYTGGVPVADRWRTNSAACNLHLESDALHMSYGSGAATEYIRQLVKSPESLSGKTLTFSAIVKGNCRILLQKQTETDTDLISLVRTEYAEFADYTLVSVTGICPADLAEMAVVIQGPNNSEFYVQAAKLEIGGYQTLAHNEGTEENPDWVLNELPDYGQELAKCRRKYVKITKIPLSGFTNSTGRYCYVDTGFEMDGTVALTVSSLGTLMTTAGNKTMSNVVAQASMSPHVCLRFELETADSTIGFRPVCIADPVIELGTE